MIVVHFDSRRELVDYLKQYKSYREELECIEKDIGIHSPSLSEEGMNGYASKIAQYNMRLSRKHELEEKMKEIEGVVNLLKDSDEICWKIIHYKYIDYHVTEYGYFDHDDYSKRIGYSSSSIYHTYHRKAINMLLDLCE
ncbi:hypothetical protein [Sharpea azabuensis]|uniref:hypothetical protein n=1 Tax=Sharpea azabuensis TaxID=322505 RepID=UPI00240A0A8D|nr:hypothetical protein [Sharpea azabuensis]MDD6512794.1 hypothetical protein [Sharpea azabuensis]